MKYAGTLRELRGNYSEGYVFVCGDRTLLRQGIRARLPNEPDLPGVANGKFVGAVKSEFRDIALPFSPLTTLDSTT